MIAPHTRVRPGLRAWHILLIIALSSTPFLACYGYLFVSIFPWPSLIPQEPLPTIHQAAAAGDWATIRQELDAGTSLDLQASATGTTPLIIAAAEGHTEIVQRLIVEGANLRAAMRGGDQAIHIAHSSAIPLLLAAGADIEAKTDFGQTPLMCQAIRNRKGDDLQAIRILLQAGASARYRDHYGRTAAQLVAGFPDADGRVLGILRQAQAEPPTAD